MRNCRDREQEIRTGAVSIGRIEVEEEEKEEGFMCG